MKIRPGTFYFIIVTIILCCALYGTVAPARAADPVVNGMIMGRATLPNETLGIAGCDVQLLGEDNYLAARTTADAEGNFIFTNVEPNDDTWGYRLIVKDGDWGQSVTQLFSVVANSTTIVAVRVYPYIGSFSFGSDKPSLNADGSAVINLAVALFDVNGKPVPDGVHVTFTQESFYPHPGTFFAGEENGTSLTLATKGGRIAVSYGAVPGDTLSRGVRLDASCAESENRKSMNLTLNLINPNVIEGTVYDATGRTVPFAKVFLYRWDGVSKYTGYNSSESDDRTDYSGICDANGAYRFAIMPAGTYQVTANESSFYNSGSVTVTRGKYTLDITLPMNRGSIHGWVKDSKDKLVPGVTVSLSRFYNSSLSPVAQDVSAADGSFSFDNIWYGRYALKAVYADKTADLSVILDTNSTSATLPLSVDAQVVTPTPAPASPTPTPRPGNATVTSKPPTPKPPTPTPPPVTPGYLISSYGIALGTVALICFAILAIMLRLKPK